MESLLLEWMGLAKQAGMDFLEWVAPFLPYVIVIACGVIGFFIGVYIFYSRKKIADMKKEGEKLPKPKKVPPKKAAKKKAAQKKAAPKKIPAKPAPPKKPRKKTGPPEEKPPQTDPERETGRETGRGAPETEVFAPVIKKDGKKEKKKQPETKEPETKKPEKKKPETKEAAPLTFAARFKNGLLKTREAASKKIDDLFSEKNRREDDLLEDIEELLIGLDMGVKTSMALIEKISATSSGLSGPDPLKQALKDEIKKILGHDPTHIDPTKTKDTQSFVCGKKPYVIMVAGVNGVGKTTSIGKLAAKYTGMGKTVLIAAADTFRAAAVEQLEIWAQKAGADIIKSKSGSDPAAVAYDALEAAMARDVDIVIVDTAGRLHTKTNLMEELKKIKRAIDKKSPGAPHEILLTLDATTGQNALTQAKMFDSQLGGVTGIILSKLDGTAKGGIVVSIYAELNIPLKYLGMGEKIDDLEEFDAPKFVDALF